MGLSDLQYLPMGPFVLEAEAGREGWELSSRKGNFHSPDEGRRGSLCFLSIGWNGSQLIRKVISEV